MPLDRKKTRKDYGPSPYGRPELMKGSPPPSEEFMEIQRRRSQAEAQMLLAKTQGPIMDGGRLYHEQHPVDNRLIDPTLRGPAATMQSTKQPTRRLGKATNRHNPTFGFSRHNEREDNDVGSVLGQGSINTNWRIGPKWKRHNTPQVVHGMATNGTFLPFRENLANAQPTLKDDDSSDDALSKSGGPDAKPKDKCQKTTARLAGSEKSDTVHQTHGCCNIPAIREKLVKFYAGMIKDDKNAWEELESFMSGS